MGKKSQFFMTRIFPCLVVLIVDSLINIFQIPCMYKTIFGIPCPGCGMSHAILAALRLDFAEAFRLHAMFWSVPLVFVLILTNGRIFPKKWMNLALIIGIGAGFLANYVWQLIVFFS